MLHVFHDSREISKPLIPLGKAGVLLVHILTLLCKGMVRSSQTLAAILCHYIQFHQHVESKPEGRSGTGLKYIYCKNLIC